MIVLLVLVFVAMFAWQVPSLVRRRLWGELAAFTVLWMAAFSLAYLQAVGVKIPSLTRGVEILFRPVSSALDRFLSS